MNTKSTNRLLDTLEPRYRNAILLRARSVPLSIRTILHPQGQSPQFAYFLTGGLASTVVTLADGRSYETSLMGNEGLIGAYSLLGGLPSPTSTFMQIDGGGYQVPIAVVQDLFRVAEDFRDRVLQQVQQAALTTSQMVACNNAHGATARLARWLLMVQDRTQAHTFALTQDFLAQMLGTRRSTVTLTADALEHEGMIHHTRGRISIVSREALEKAACECYPVTVRLLQNMYVRETTSLA